MRSGSALFKIRRDAVLCFAVRPVFAAEDVSTPRVAASRTATMNSRHARPSNSFVGLRWTELHPLWMFLPPPVRVQPRHVRTIWGQTTGHLNRCGTGALLRQTCLVFPPKRGQNMARSFHPGFLALTPRLQWLPPPWLGSRCRPIAVSTSDEAPSVPPSRVGAQGTEYADAHRIISGSR